MRSLLLFVNFFTSFHFMLCRDFYMGMFHHDDYLVAQDNLYKEKRPYTRVQAEYGRLFKCPITYFRVVDRLGMGPGPIVKILKGGLQKNYIAIRLQSGYNLPISVNIYIGCENKEPRRPIRPTKPTKPTTTAKDELDSTTNESVAAEAAESTTTAEATTADSGQATIEHANKKEDPDTGAESTKNPDDENGGGPSALKKKKKNKDNQHNTV